MDATRPRRLRDHARRSWYARWRSARFARHLGFPPAAAVTPEPQARPGELPGGLPACLAGCRPGAGEGNGLAPGVPALAGGWFFPAVRWGLVLASFWAALVWGASERPLRWQRAG
jgi:hypothetical protein